VLAGSLWELPEREFQYAACDLVAKHVRVCGPGFIATARTLITSKSWWDTVDSLASDVVGDLVRRFPDLAATMDEWLESENLWVVRSAILHQLRFKEATDTDRLFAYCLRRADHKDFFIRKAIGWALRQYSWTDPEAVKRFVAEHEAELSPLSRREALLAITGHRKRQPASTDAPATPAARTGS
jgi:3-methyladenine DNA glycosylase AlkD